MTTQQRHRFYSALQQRHAAVFRFGVLESLSDLQLRLCARALQLEVEEETVADLRPPPIALRQQAQTPAAVADWRPRSVVWRTRDS